MQTNNIKSAMQNGLILGILFSVNFLISVSKNQLLGSLSNLLVIAILVLVYRMTVNYREKDCFGAITYFHAFRYITLLFMYAAIISAMTKYVYMKFIDIGCAERIYEKSYTIMTELMQTKVGQQEEEVLQGFYTPINYTFMLTCMNYLAGTFVGLIMSIFIKKTTSYDSNQPTQ